MTSLTPHCDARGAAAGLVGRAWGGAKSRARAPEAVLVTQVRPTCAQVSRVPELRPALAHRPSRPGPLPPASSLSGPPLPSYLLLPPSRPRPCGSGEPGGGRGLENCPGKDGGRRHKRNSGTALEPWNKFSLDLTEPLETSIKET